MSPDQLHALHVPPSTLGCVGVDWWGWKMVGKGSAQVIPDHTDCPWPRPPLTLGDVLNPYLHHSFLLFRLAAWALPEHFTVHYFEVVPANSYFRPSTGENYHNGSVLFAASKVREAVVTRLWIPLALAGMLLALLPGRMPSGERAFTLFLALAVPSQIAMCLLGEGVRDLSKHLAGAQLCLDLLSVMCLLQMLRYVAVISNRLRIGRARPPVAIP